MLHSHTYRELAFDYFTSFLMNVISGKSKYEEFVRPIISDAHSLAVGDKDYYKIDRNGYPVIVFLVEKEKDYFEQLDIDNLSIANYSHILELVTNAEESISRS